MPLYRENNPIHSAFFPEVLQKTRLIIKKLKSRYILLHDYMYVYCNSNNDFGNNPYLQWLEIENPVMASLLEGMRAVDDALNGDDGALSDEK